LEVQDHDTVVDQLRHRRATLPERAELARIDRRRGELDAQAKEVGGERDELGARQATLEQQIDASRARRAELERKMYGGQEADARALGAMNDEVRQLARHITELEDRELEVMEALEPLDAALAAADAEREALDGDTRRLLAAVAEAERALDADIATQRDARAGVAATLPDPLLTRYEKLRTRLGGTGAARLSGSSCGGCHLVLPAMEVDRIRKAPPDAVITCDQCGRILVR